MSAPLPYRNPNLPIQERVDDLLSRMTLAEKVGQMLQLNGQQDPVGLVERVQPGALLHILNEPLAQAMDAAAKTRLGIPLLIGEDGIHGHSFHPGATIFPTQLALASSFNPELLEGVARVTAREMSTTGAHWTFSPVLCLSRDIRWGRTGETFGEDPFLIGELGAAMVRGYQGKGLNDPEAVLACAKHYAGYSETQGGRDASEADISRRKLRSYFLPPFQRAVEAGCRTFMTGYQSMDGLPSTANRWLLRTVLKEEWGFRGILVTDWDNVGTLVTKQRIAPTLVEAAVIAVRCGNDLIMSTPGFFEAAQTAVQQGLLHEAEIDEVVRRILIIKFELGLFENPRRPDRASQRSVIACEEHQDFNLEASRQAWVLLENDGILPLDSHKMRRIAVLGPNADDPVAQLGDWSLGSSQYLPSAGTHPRSCTSTVLDGLKERFGTEVEYLRGAQIQSNDTSEIAAAVELARQAQLTVVVLGDNISLIGETLSTATLDLQGSQRALLEAVAESGARFILVLVCSKPLVLPLAASKAAAVLCAFNPGMQGGRALAEVLSGALNPCAKLAISWPLHVGQQPVFYSQVPGQHGERYADLTQDPRYRFGHGLSYTSFQYANPRVAQTELEPNEDVQLELLLTNTGLLAGTEIAQVYLRDVVTSVTWPTQRLVAFQRISLQPGEQRLLQFEIPRQLLALIDAYGESRVEPGEFELLVGGSSRIEELQRVRFRIPGQAFSFASIPGVLGPA